MAGAQHSSHVSLAPLFFGTMFCVVITVAGWGVAFWATRESSGQPAARGGKGGAPPRYRYIEQDPFDGPFTSPIRERVERDADRLHSYGWADPQRRTAHLPIERAKALLLERRGSSP